MGQIHADRGERRHAETLARENAARALSGRIETAALAINGAVIAAVLVLLWSFSRSAAQVAASAKGRSEEPDQGFSEVASEVRMVPDIIRIASLVQGIASEGIVSRGGPGLTSPVLGKVGGRRQPDALAAEQLAAIAVDLASGADELEKAVAAFSARGAVWRGGEAASKGLTAVGVVDGCPLRRRWLMVARRPTRRGSRRTA